MKFFIYLSLIQFNFLFHLFSSFLSQEEKTTTVIEIETINIQLITEKKEEEKEKENEKP